MDISHVIMPFGSPARSDFTRARDRRDSSLSWWESEEVDVAMIAANAPRQLSAATLQDEFTRAAANGDMEQLLELKGIANVDINGQNKYGRSAIQVMTMAIPEVAEFLLKSGADPNVRDRDVGRTPLHDAAEHGHEDTVRLLLKHGADPLVRDMRGDTPAHLAAVEGRPPQILELLSRGCSMWERNNAGRTPLDEADRNERRETKRWIQNYHSSGKGTALKHLCRLAIHRVLGTQRLPRVRELIGSTLPKALVEYLEMAR
ncbi:cyclin-dependent kinase 4 inhibitor C-like isoform X2 [Acanthaster planci]|uniref:Cyclin-dependent kinase 4 inhibitor C-like isoform X2 n=1 Tax=Acanthaster planci TaxID=133434 RepID=A0A8B7ZA37_ACAPL|nr:cyclin-dependent kinase 4 inhibitor C-like isoform X2 [Acanthaster planci]